MVSLKKHGQKTCNRNVNAKSKGNDVHDSRERTKAQRKSFFLFSPFFLQAHRRMGKFVAWRRTDSPRHMVVWNVSEGSKSVIRSVLNSTTCFFELNDSKETLASQP